MNDHRIYHPQQLVYPIGNPSKINRPASVKPNETGKTFGQLLDQEMSGVKFSQHALQRLQARSIQIDQAGMAKLNGAVDKAAQKGAKESLILMDNVALVVSVKNRTVITAVDGSSMKDNVFTNIDSAVII